MGFRDLATPWLRCGFNVLPIRPGAPRPEIAGWGQGPGCLHSKDSKRVDPEAFERWCRDFPDANCAVLPGSADAMVVDVDIADFAPKAVEICGPTDYWTQTSRGFHLWYAGATSSRNKICPKVDIKSTGGFVVAPYSMHRTGVLYQPSPALYAGLVAGRLDLPAPLDGWRLRLSQIKTTLTNPTRLELEMLAQRLAGNQATSAVGKRLRQISRGESFAEPGERENAIFHCVRVMLQEWPACSQPALVALFESSAQAMEREADVGIPILDQVRIKWERQTAHQRESDAEKEFKIAADRATAWSWVGASEEGPADPDEGPIVVHAGRSFFLRVGSSWAGPWTKDEITPDVRRVLGALYGTYTDSLSDLLEGYAVKAARRIDSLDRDPTWWDPTTRTIHVSLSQVRRDLVPAHDPAVDEALRRMGGQYADHLIHWLSGLLRTDHPARALILSGPRGVGKSLLLAGLSRLWLEGAVNMSDVLGRNFNSQIATATLAVADDDEQDATASGDALAQYLRHAVTARSQRLERKHHDVVTVRGSMRFAVATNDPLALVRGAVSYKMSASSLDAYGDRLLHVPVRTQWWEPLTPTELVDGDRIARHVLWLTEQSPQPLERFWTPPADVRLGRMASLSSGLRGDLVARIVEELPRATEWQGQPEQGWLYRWGPNLIVFGRRLFSAWVIDRPREAKQRTVIEALAHLADSSGAPKLQTPEVSAVVTQELIMDCARGMRLL